jgi:signal peptidase II
MEPRRTPRGLLVVIFLAVAGSAAALDLWTKDAIFDLLQVQSAGNPPSVIDQTEIEIIPGYFDLQANYNYGAFSGWFSKHPGWLTALSAAALCLILWIVIHHAWRSPTPSITFVIALALLWGGTLGNFHDRVLIGAVRDWIKWFFVHDGREIVWPNFNIADSAICTGVGLIVLLEILNAARERKKKPVSAPNAAVTPPSPR